MFTFVIRKKYTFSLKENWSQNNKIQIHLYYSTKTEKVKSLIKTYYKKLYESKTKLQVSI